MIAPESIKKFPACPEKIFERKFIPAKEYIVHASGVEADEKSPYAYRIKLAYDRLETLFGSAEKNFDDFVRKSRISQAEAKKIFHRKIQAEQVEKDRYNMVEPA